MDDVTRAFIAAHAEDDVRRLALQASRYPLVDMPYALQQIEGRQKARRKLPTLYAHPETEYPPKLPLEQCSGEAAARYKAGLVSGNLLVDMTGGFGVDCLFMSERFREAVYVERQADLLRTAEHNFRLFGRQHIRCIAGDGVQAVAALTQQADWIYVDPARRGKSGQKTILLSDCEPDMTQIIGLLRQKAAHIMVKLSPMLDINAAIAQLPCTTAVHVLSAGNECKEVLLTIAGTQPADYSEPDIIAARLAANGTQLFRFTKTEEQQAEPAYTTQLRAYLYEPDAAILKAGAFKTLAVRLGLEKLHPNTHLYTSDTFLPCFCGRVFSMEAQFGWQKNVLKQLRADTPQANIAVRNFPEGPENLHKKLRIAPGGDVFLFAATLSDGTRTLLKARKTPLQ